MGSEEMVEWDSIAEEELRSIEQAYADSKRKASSSSSSSSHPHVDLDPDLNEGDGCGSSGQKRRLTGRRLPSWAEEPSRISTAVNSSHQRRGWGVNPRPCRSNLKVKYPQMSFGGRIVYSRTATEVEQAAMEIFNKIKARKPNEDQISLGFDIEWKPTFKAGEAPRKAAVMQICIDTYHCYVLHIIHSGIPPILKSLLEDSSSVKVGVCIANDAMKISRDYNVSVEPLEDLSECANLKLVGPSRRWSLCFLTETLTCKELPKPAKIRLGNWERTPLSKEQLQYAATDAFASWYIYEVLKTFPNAKPERQF